MKIKFYNTLLTAIFLATSCFISVANAGLIKSYDFNGDLSDTLANGVDMTASGGALGGGLYTFGHNQGLRLTSALSDTADYAIEMRLRIDDDLSSWNKLLDFEDLTSDNGLYLFDGNFDFYVSGQNILGGPVNLNEFFTISFVRSAGVITTYYNGVALTPFIDSLNQAIPSSNILNFFEDDTLTAKGESFSGAVDYIRIHGDDSTFGDDPGIPVHEPGTILLFGLALLGTFASRRKKL